MSWKNDSYHSATSFWDARRKKIYSRVGGWQGGKDAISHGYSIIHELIGHSTYMQLMILNATGRMVDRNLAAWFEMDFMGMSYPDSRIWCNQIGVMAGNTRSTPVSALVAGVLASDSRAYGGSQTCKIGMSFIQNALTQFKNGTSIDEIVESARKKNNKPDINGFARPVSKQDERISPYERVTKELGFEVGEHLTLAYEIGRYLERKYELDMNIGGYTCAFYSDQDFSGDDIYQIKAGVVASGVMACYRDYVNQPEDSFLPLKCKDILYEGHQPRDLP